MKAIAAGGGAAVRGMGNAAAAARQRHDGNNGKEFLANGLHSNLWSNGATTNITADATASRSVSLTRARGGAAYGGRYGHADGNSDDPVSVTAQHAAGGEDSLYDALLSELAKATDQVWRGGGISHQGGGGEGGQWEVLEWAQILTLIQGVLQ